MRETLYAANGLDETRVKRAFSWVVTFRDFPAGSYQTVDGDSMMTEALTFFTKGCAEFYLDGVRRGDRVPGILSSEHDVVGQGGIFTLKYVEPTTRLCIPAAMNKNRLPSVKKHELRPDHPVLMHGKFLVCLGSVSVMGKNITEERTFQTAEPRVLLANEGTILLEFLD